MKRFAIALLLTLGAAGAAQAESKWNGAGWYEVADTIVGPFVWSGPYASEEECKAHLHPNEDDADYACEYLSDKPNWDS